MIGTCLNIRDQAFIEIDSDGLSNWGNTRDESWIYVVRRIWTMIPLMIIRSCLKTSSSGYLVSERLSNLKYSIRSGALSSIALVSLVIVVATIVATGIIIVSISNTSTVTSQESLPPSSSASSTTMLSVSSSTISGVGASSGTSSYVPATSMLLITSTSVSLSSVSSSSTSTILTSATIASVSSSSGFVTSYSSLSSISSTFRTTVSSSTISSSSVRTSVTTSTLSSTSSTPYAVCSSTKGNGVLVGIVDEDFVPSAVAVIIGVNNTVTWTNQGGEVHTVTAADGGFDSGGLNTGQSFTCIFTQAGTYSYYCSIHPQMTGIVTVKPKS